MVQQLISEQQRFNGFVRVQYFALARYRIKKSPAFLQNHVRARVRYRRWANTSATGRRHNDWKSQVSSGRTKQWGSSRTKCVYSTSTSRPIHSLLSRNAPLFFFFYFYYMAYFVCAPYRVATCSCLILYPFLPLFPLFAPFFAPFCPFFYCLSKSRVARQQINKKKPHSYPKRLLIFFFCSTIISCTASNL